MTHETPNSSRRQSLGQALVHRGLISPAQLDDALRLKSRRGGRLGSHLVALGYAKQDEVDRVWVEHNVTPGLEEALDRACGNRFTAEADRRIRFNDVKRQEVLVENMLDGSASATLKTEIVGEAMLELRSQTSMAMRFSIDASTGFCVLDGDAEIVARRWIPSILAGPADAVQQPALPDDFEDKLRRLMAG